MARKTKVITCPACEGTGKKLNMYDPPEKNPDPPATIYDLKERSPSGREIYNRPCKECNQTGLISVLDI